MSSLICCMMVVWSAVSVATVVWLGRSTATEASTTTATAAEATTQVRLYQTGFSGVWAMMAPMVNGSSGPGWSDAFVGHRTPFEQSRRPSRPPLGERMDDGGLQAVDAEGVLVGEWRGARAQLVRSGR